MSTRPYSHRTVRRTWISALALALALPGCGGGELVELRLYPCMFGAMADMPPASVRLTINSFDESGAPVDQALTETFTIDDPGAQFADGYATVGYRKSADVVSADFRVVWLAGAGAPSGAGEQEVVHAGVTVPDPGASIDLFSEGQCADGGGETTDAMTTGETTGSMTTEVATTDGTDTSTGSSSDGTSDGSTGTSTSSTSDTDATTESDTTTTGPEEDPALGEPCDPMGFHGTLEFCWTEGYGEIGTLFQCKDLDDDGQYLWEDAVDAVCTCAQDVPGTVNAGCSGNGANDGPPIPFDCLCMSADMDEDCGLPIQACNGMDLMFCVDGHSYKAICPGGCLESEGLPMCGPNDTPIKPDP